MASVVAGGLFTAIAFAGAGYVFHKLDKSGYEAEMERHNKTMEEFNKEKMVRENGRKETFTGALGIGIGYFPPGYCFKLKLIKCYHTFEGMVTYKMSVRLFDNKDLEVSLLSRVDDDGEICLKGKDVAIALGYFNPNSAIQRHVIDKYKFECSKIQGA